MQKTLHTISSFYFQLFLSHFHYRSATSASRPLLSMRAQEKAKIQKMIFILVEKKKVKGREREDEERRGAILKRAGEDV